MKGSGTHYDYGFRIYDPRVGRFLSVDPLFKSYSFYSPYQFAGNKPIFAVDLDGLEECPNELVNAGKRIGKNLIKRTVNYIVGKVFSSLFDAANEKVKDELDQKVNSSNHIDQVIGLTGEFILGVNEEKRFFGPNEPITKSLKNSNLTKAAVKAFWEGYQDFKEGRREDVPPYYVAEFGWPILDDSGPLSEGITSAAQFVGTATYIFNFNEESGILTINVFDDKNEWSLKYHSGERDSVNHERGDEGESSFFSTTYQQYLMEFSVTEIKDMVE